MANVSIDWCRQEDLPQLQRLIHESWRPDHVMSRDGELFRWQYRFPGRPELFSVLAARNGSEIVGFLGLIQADFCDVGERIPGAWMAMWFSKSSDAGAGLQLLRHALQSHFRFVGCVGINDTALQLYRLMRFDIVERLPRWIRVISPSALSRLLEGSESEYRLAARNAWLETGRVSGTSSSTEQLADDRERFQLRHWDAGMSSRWDEAWNTQLSRAMRGTWRDAAHISWRFVDHPRFAYRVVVAEDVQTGGLQGLVAYRLEQVASLNVSVLRIVELLGEPAARQLLAKSALAEGVKADAAFADFQCSAKSVGDDLRGIGFRPEDEVLAPLPSLFQPLDTRRAGVRGAFWRDANRNDGIPLTSDRCFYVTCADGDQDRPN